MSNDIKFVLQTNENINNINLNNYTKNKAETGVDTPLIEVSNYTEKISINDEEALKVLNEEYIKQDANEYGNNYDSSINAVFSQLGFNGADTDKINYDEKTSSFYIMPDKWTPESGDKDLSTTYNILKNIYGVNYYSEEGQEIFEQLKLNNPDVFNEDGTQFNHDVPIILTHIDSIKSDLPENDTKPETVTQNNNETSQVNEYGFTNTVADKINKNENDSCYYIMPDKWTADGDSTQLSTPANILKSVYGYDFYSNEGQKIYDAIKEINPNTFDENYSFNHDMPVILPDANDVLNGTFNKTQYKPTSIKAPDGTVANYAYDTEGNLTSKTIDTTAKGGKIYEEYYDKSNVIGTITTGYDNKGNKIKEFTYNGTKNSYSGTITTKNGYDYVKTNEEQNSSPYINHAYTYLPDGTMIRYSIEDGFINEYSKDGITKKIDDGRTRNGKIEYTRQQATGDCWLLAGINALSYTDGGSNMIRNCITYDNTAGTASVYLKGIDKTYTVSYNELEEAKNKTREGKTDINMDSNSSVIVRKIGSKYSKGDDDMLLLELAIEQALVDAKHGNLDFKSEKVRKRLEGQSRKYTDDNDVLDGGQPCTAMYLITGKDWEATKDEVAISDAFSKFENNSKNMALALSFKDELDENCPSSDKVVSNHCYSVKYVNSDTIGLVNPWDSSEIIEIPREDCINMCTRIDYITF